MNARNTLGLPENCRDCTAPSCIELLCLLTDTVKVNLVGNELRAYPPREPFFERGCADAILKLSICMNRRSTTETLPENI